MTPDEPLPPDPQKKPDEHEDPVSAREPDEPIEKDEPAGDEAEETQADPYDAASETGPVFDAPPSGSDDAEAGEDRTWRVLCHALSHPALFGIACLHFLAPFLLWYVFKRDDVEVEHHAKEAFNFQISMLLAGWIGGLMSLTCLLAPFGIPIFLAAVALAFVMPIVAAVKTANGEFYRYPLTYRFLT